MRYDLTEMIKGIKRELSEIDTLKEEIRLLEKKIELLKELGGIEQNRFVYVPVVTTPFVTVPYHQYPWCPAVTWCDSDISGTASTWEGVKHGNNI